ncbi:MAG: hypothetical protein K6T75_08275 [Acetobacteraceae bacterium]|nr:hypothetical protein [Acetobacteraceae bacterium]
MRVEVGLPGGRRLSAGYGGVGARDGLDEGWLEAAVDRVAGGGGLAGG